MNQLTGLDSILQRSIYRTTSRHKYSFGKSQRFSANKSSFTIDFYDKPQLKNTRTCSFGYGSKYFFNKPQKTPTPFQYQVQQKNTPGISFGTSREKVIVGDYLRSQQLKKSPSADKYNPDLKATSKYKSGFLYSLGKKYESDSFIQPTQNPQPTKYNPTLQINGKTTLSKFNTTNRHAFPKSPRFNQHLKNPEIGPNKYSPNDLANSKHSNSKRNVFSLAAKTTFADAAIKCSATPGPIYYVQ